MSLKKQQISQLLIQSLHHYQASLSLLQHQANSSVTRAAYRFLRIESSMLNKISHIYFDKELDDFIKHYQVDLSVKPVKSYQDFFAKNCELLTQLKGLIRQIDFPEFKVQVSYWIAALQMENDEIRKHIAE